MSFVFVPVNRSQFMSTHHKWATGREVRKRYKCGIDVGDFDKVEPRGGASFFVTMNTMNLIHHQHRSGKNIHQQTQNINNPSLYRLPLPLPDCCGSACGGGGAKAPRSCGSYCEGWSYSPPVILFTMDLYCLSLLTLLFNRSSSNVINSSLFFVW